MRGPCLAALASVLLVCAALRNSDAVHAGNQLPIVFTDVARQSGIAFQHDNAASPEKYLIETMGSGAAWLDYDNDGHLDLYVANGAATPAYTPPRPLRAALYRNNGNGTFTDVTEKAGVAAAGLFGMGVAAADYDNDGFPDLFVAGYGRSILYHNNGDGTFTDVSVVSKIGAKPGNGLGVLSFDFNGDGWPDVFISNDSMENFLFVNQRNGTFREMGMQAGVALSDDGKAEAGMGVDSADYDHDGRPDLFITHLDLEWNRLYRNRGDGTFDDATFTSKIGSNNYHLSGFGTGFIDYDNDGWPDIFIANGHVLDNIDLFHAGTSWAEPKTMYRNAAGSFQVVSNQLGADFLLPRAGRAAAFADYDNDGDVDILVMNCGQAPQLLRNDGGNSRHWLGVRLTGVKSNRDGIGAKVRVKTGNVTQIQEAKGGSSYQASHDPRLHFGLGEAARVDLLQVEWPSGAVDRITNISADRFVNVKEGAGSSK